MAEGIGFEFTERAPTAKGGFFTKKKQKVTGLENLLTGGIFMFLGYLLLAGVLGWNPQLIWLLLIGYLIWRFI